MDQAVGPLPSKNTQHFGRFSIKTDISVFSQLIKLERLDSWVCFDYGSELMAWKSDLAWFAKMMSLAKNVSEIGRVANLFLGGH